MTTLQKLCGKIIIVRVNYNIEAWRELVIRRLYDYWTECLDGISCETWYGIYWNYFKHQDDNGSISWSYLFYWRKTLFTIPSLLENMLKSKFIRSDTPGVYYILQGSYVYNGKLYPPIGEDSLEIDVEGYERELRQYMAKISKVST